MGDRDHNKRVALGVVTPLYDPSGKPLFAVKVGKGAYELTNSLPSRPMLSTKDKQKNRDRNKAARKAKKHNR